MGKDEKGRDILNLRRFPATYLGSSEMTLLDATLAYTTFPDAGSRPVEPFIIQRIVDKDGNLIFESHPQRKYVFRDTTAYEVHSCLSDVLDWGTGDKANTVDGLKKYPLSGKTGTAYNFTDDWFIGYSSAITCGVWAGFDKPSTIYRGAFSSDVVLPIWVDVMNASFHKYAAEEIAQPHGLQKYESCTASGQLATDQCYETVANKDGTSARHRTTYFELATAEQVPKDKCTVHTAGGTVAKAVPIGQSPLDTSVTPSQYPRAKIAMDLSKVNPVPIMGATVVGDEDPYQSVRPVMAATRVSDGAQPPGAANDSVPSNANGPTAPAGFPGTSGNEAPAMDGTVPVMRAQAAGVMETTTQSDSVIHLDPPDPIKF
jgi:penicillin-binding protein 1A